MNAQEARRKASSIELVVHAKELYEIEKAIKDAVEKGNFKAFYYESMSLPIEAELRRRGFTVDSFADPRDGLTYTISW